MAQIVQVLPCGKQKHVVNMAADDLMTPGARASAAIVLTSFLNVPISAPKGSKCKLIETFKNLDKL